MCYAVPFKDWGQLLDRGTYSYADASEPAQHPRRPPVLPHSHPYASAVPLLRAKLPHFLLVVPIRASASSHPRLRLSVALPPTDGWLAFLFRVLQFPGSNLGQKGFCGFSSFPAEIPGMVSQTSRKSDATGVFITDLIACSTCFGHHYAHHQELKSIIQWLLPVVFRAVVCWSGV